MLMVGSVDAQTIGQVRRKRQGGRAVLLEYEYIACSLSHLFDIFTLRRMADRHNEDKRPRWWTVLPA